MRYRTSSFFKLFHAENLIDVLSEEPSLKNKFFFSFRLNYGECT